MRFNKRLMRHPFPQEGGFTLLEVLVALGVLTIALLGVAAALSSGGLSMGADFGVAAISRGNSYSTAMELAQARIEEIKNATYTVATDQIINANFPDEGYGAIAGSPGFRRTVTITPGTPPPPGVMKTITVRVFFRPQYQSQMGQEESVLLATVIARRP